MTRTAVNSHIAKHRRRRWLFGALGLAVASALLIIACSSDEIVAVQTPTPSPDVQATVRGQVRATSEALSVERAAAAIVSPEDRETLRGFVEAYKNIEVDWEQLRRDFDGWRLGLVECDISSRQHNLRNFAGRMTALREDARQLPRSEFVSPITDRLIAAADRESAAFRQLERSDFPISAVEDNGEIATDPRAVLETERTSSAASRTEAVALLADLSVQASLEGRAQILRFGEAVAEISALWNGVLEDYESLRRAEPSISSEETLGSISDLIVDIVEVVRRTRSLPLGGSTAEIASQLAATGEASELAARQLREAFTLASAGGEQSGQQASPPAVGTENGESAENGDSSAPDETPPSVEVGSTPFGPFETELVMAGAMRHAASVALAELTVGSSTAAQAAGAEFAAAYTPLASGWDTLHKDYDNWLSSEGGCDRRAAVAALGGFALTAGDIAGRFRLLPVVASARTLGELLIEAAEREEQALTALRNSWQPFDNSAYEPLELARDNANQLRRQVDAGVDDLLAD